ncbi:MAG TPA: decaprenyl-phosphate phosphoribosyltransferase [Burkholderiales bacterium]|nr:decaprenyl-phosphate phosphoribosyltransferase [Burkholderiales bacterium]
MPANAILLRELPQRPDAAVFDLDGTLTHGDTLSAFLRFVAPGRDFALRASRALPALAGWALRLVERDRAKQAVLAAFLRGMPREELERAGAAFASERLPGMMRAEALERLAWHRAQGHRCVLLSASPRVYVEPWARAAGFDDVVATELAFDADGRATGEFAGANCRGEEKVRRLRAALGDPAGWTLHGYGDSPADRAFLALCAPARYRPFRGDDEGETRLDRPRDLARLMRPHQWVKNGFVFIGLIFGHAWGVPELVLAAVLAAAGFSLAASAIYIVNDFADRARDRLHPTKRRRPLASGRVTPAAALALAAALAVSGGALAFAAGPKVLAVVTLYVLMNLGYTFGLKGVVILDVFIISAGFMLRILAGTLGIGVPPSQWLLLCGFLLTLFLGFTKRRAEMLALSGDMLAHRKSLSQYGGEMLDKLIGICGAGVIMSYSLYTMNPDTVRMHGTSALIYTVPFVVYGMFRYLYLLHRESAGTDTSRDLARDPHMLGAVGGWLLATVGMIAA